MATAPQGLTDLLPLGITTGAMRMEFTSNQITLFLFIVVTMMIGLGFMAYLFVSQGEKQNPELDRPQDNRRIWLYENSSSSQLDLL
jgi:hypothetical protein